MATYGSIPGVRISTSTGTVTGVTIGREQYLVLVGVGTENAEVEPNDPVQIDGRGHVSELFGAESDVERAYNQALANGVNPSYVQAVRAETSTTTTTTGTEGELADTPIVPSVDRVHAEHSDGVELTVQFRYEDPVDPPENENEIYINPITGEFDSEPGDDTVEEIEINYDHADWSAALDGVENALVEGEFGVISPLTPSYEVTEDLAITIEKMRDDIKMVVGSQPAEPNGTSDGGYPHVDVETFELSLNDDTLFMPTPTTLEGAEPTIASYAAGAQGAIAGLLAGNDTTDPIYDDTLAGIEGIEQQLARSDVTELREQSVIPVRDIGTPRLTENQSTFDGGNDEWERDFFRRRVVDLVIATLYQITRAQIGTILDGDTVEDVADAINRQLEDFEDDGLLHPDGQQFSVYRADDRTIGVDATITPYGVAKSADIDLEVNA